MAQDKQAAASRPQLVLTPAELAQFKGNKEETGNESIYVSLRGTIFDVSSARAMYGPEGGYKLFAGLDASRALAKMSFKPEDVNSTELGDLTLSERDTLTDWYNKFEGKYPVVGVLAKDEEDKKAKLAELAAAESKM